ncbi:MULTISPECIES: hypothetical protein [unclassified Pseudomonas]|uniref:hypothetical protein n=1 Tax=unclassified Pseudomonas TaxID=196821 RepID=UPI00200C95D7|nr:MULTISPECIES: hypothetical protein [unclassified Pseudomonas]
MTEPVKVKKWSYPIKIGGAGGTDPQRYYAALAKAQDGYYPLGGNGLWHGGVHFDEASGLVSAQSEVRCIADGQVVAYRIDDTYPATVYTDRTAFASTGFVLVKHLLEMPAPPTPSANSGAAQAAGPILTFYSLYMHLLDMEGYRTKTPMLERPSYWANGGYQVKAGVSDPVEGLNVRADLPGTAGYTNILTTLPRGTTVTTGVASTDGKWLKVVSVVPEADQSAAIGGWVFKAQMNSKGENQYLIGELAKNIPANQAKGLRVRRTGSTTGEVMSILPAGTQVEISQEGAVGNYRKLVKVVSGAPIPALATDENGNVGGYVWFPSLETKTEPKDLGKVVLLDNPVAIKAGALVGFPGHYQEHDEGIARNLVHVEVFTCEDIEKFVSLSREKAAALPAAQKNLMKVHKDTKLITHRSDISATNPPQANDSGVVNKFDLIIPTSVLESLPDSKKIKQTITTPGVGTGPAATSTTRWWLLEGLLGDAQGNPISGWLGDKDLITTRHNPWDWVGFKFIEETGSNADHLSSYLHDRDLLTEEEKATFVPMASTSIKGPVKEGLYDIIDTDKNGKLTTTEIQAALAKPWFAQSISQLVTKCESEWYYDANKWDALDGLMGHTVDVPNLNWVAQKKRIKEMSWWKDVAIKEALNSDGKVWHIHSIGLIGNFEKKKQCSCNPVVKVTRYHGRYGPAAWGEGKLGDAPQWGAVTAAKNVTAFEKKVISVMCENEGKVNTVQAYDSEIISAGAMQKTVNTDGEGELPIQVKNFKMLYPDEYVELFENQGWYLDLSAAEPRMYYQDPEYSSGEKLEKGPLKSKLRQGCGEHNFLQVIQCKPVSVLSCAVGSPEYVELQISEFVDRLRDVRIKTISTYSFTVGQLFLSTLGLATVLDEHVNRPNNVGANLKRALNKFFLENPTVSKDITTWGSNHAAYERKITDIYGPNRIGMTEPLDRYTNLKAAAND